MSNIISKISAAKNIYELEANQFSKNISKANIPNAKSMHLESNFSNLIDNKNKVNLNSTNLAHIHNGSDNIKIRLVKSKTDSNLNGNNIDLKQESANLANSAENVKTMSDLFKQWIKLIKSSIGN